MSSQRKEDQYGAVLASLFVKPHQVASPSPLSSEQLDAMFLARYNAVQGWLDRFSSTSASPFDIQKDALIFHVAGTKGKGSTSVLLEATLREAGYKTAIFTSPHLHTARERIKVDGKLITKADFIRLGEAVLAAEAANQLPGFFNFFDRLTLVALAFFTEQRVNAIVLETGLGGRYDTTNALKDTAVAACLLTSISFDHQEILGDTLEKIAWQKAGIIKPGTAVVVNASQPDSVRQVFATEARERAAASYLEVSAPTELKEILNSTKNTQFNIRHAAYQEENAALVWSALEQCCPQLKKDLPQLVESAVEKVSWPSRFEIFDVHPACTFVVDGAHNEDSVQKLLAGAVEFKNNRQADQIWSIFGSGETRNWAEMVAATTQVSSRTWFVRSSHFRAMDPNQFMTAVPTGEWRSSCAVWSASVGDAVAHVLELCKSSSGKVVVLVFGSLFVSGEARYALWKAGLATLPAHDPVHEADDAMPANYK